MNKLVSVDATIERISKIDCQSLGAEHVQEEI